MLQKLKSVRKDSMKRNEKIWMLMKFRARDLNRRRRSAKSPWCGWRGRIKQSGKMIETRRPTLRIKDATAGLKSSLIMEQKWSAKLWSRPKNSPRYNWGMIEKIHTKYWPPPNLKLLSICRCRMKKQNMLLLYEKQDLWTFLEASQTRSNNWAEVQIHWAKFQ